MFVRWQNSKSIAKRKWRTPPGTINRVRAVLVESVRVGGKPRQKCIAFIASYVPEDRRSHHHQGKPQCGFWREVNECLDRLGNRITPADRAKIESAIADRVPRPSREDQERSERERAAFLAMFMRGSRHVTA